MEYERIDEATSPSQKRLKNYKEFVIALNDEQAKIQGARCMDCGTPFCNNGCPVNNIIPTSTICYITRTGRAPSRCCTAPTTSRKFTGRICPAPCEAACTLSINNDPIGIKSIEHAMIDRAWEEGWVKAVLPRQVKTGKRWAVVGSGPAGMAAQQLARVGHDVTLFEKNDRIGGLLRYGIPDFKMEKSAHLSVPTSRSERREIRTSVFVGAAKDGLGKDSKVTNWAKETSC